jgi:hypothetical protein
MVMATPRYGLRLESIMAGVNVAGPAKVGGIIKLA